MAALAGPNQDPHCVHPSGRAALLSACALEHLQDSLVCIQWEQIRRSCSVHGLLKYNQVGLQVKQVGMLELHGMAGSWCAAQDSQVIFKSCSTQPSSILLALPLSCAWLAHSRHQVQSTRWTVPDACFQLSSKVNALAFPVLSAVSAWLPMSGHGCCSQLYNALHRHLQLDCETVLAFWL